MVNRQHSDDTDGDEFAGEQEPDGPQDALPVFFDVAEISDEETEWWQGPEYTRAQREAERGADAMWRILRGVTHLGTRVRTKAWQTRDAEPVTRVDLHPQGWLELEARLRDLEERAADGDRYRRLMGMLRAGRLIADDEDAETWWHKYCPDKRAMDADGLVAR